MAELQHYNTGSSSRKRSSRKETYEKRTEKKRIIKAIFSLLFYSFSTLPTCNNTLTASSYIIFLLFYIFCIITTTISPTVDFWLPASDSAEYQHRVRNNIIVKSGNKTVRVRRLHQLPSGIHCACTGGAVIALTGSR